jgi:hypothetical protein
LKLREIVERIEADGGEVFLRYGRYAESAYSDVLDAMVQIGSIDISVSTDWLGLGSRLTEEHEQAIARMLEPIVGFVTEVKSFRIGIARQDCTLPDSSQAAEQLKSAGATEVEFSAYGARHHEGVWHAAIVEIHDVHYKLHTRAHGEAPESEHEYVLAWYMQRLAYWFRKPTLTTEK